MPNSGAHTVHRRITATYHHNPLALRIQRAIVKFRHRVAKAFAVAGRQKIQRRNNTCRPNPGSRQIPRFVNAGRNQDGMMSGADVGKADILPHATIQNEGNTPRLQLRNPLHDNIFFQFEAGNAIGQQPARAVIAVVHRHLHTLPAQHVCRSQPAGPRANNRHRLGPFCKGNNRLYPTIFPREVGQVFLNRPNGHRAVARLFDHAVAFAKPVLRADATAYFGKGIRSL